MRYFRYTWVLPVTALLFLAGVEGAAAQQDFLSLNTDDSAWVQPNETDQSPAGAFLRSMLLPGWGHIYAGDSHKNRGYIHTGTDLVLLGSIFGFRFRANRLEDDYITFANLNAGVDLSSRNRTFQLAVGDFDSLDEYNDYQLRTRNWNRLIEDNPENRWLWNSSDERNRFRDLRSEVDNIRNQLPAIAGLMVLNRIVSGISSYNRVKREVEDQSMNLSFIPVRTETGFSAVTEITGVQAQLTFYFK